MFAAGSVPRTVNSLFSLDGWTDKRSLLEEERQKIKSWTFVLHPEISEEGVLSAPEVFDPKTDVGCLESIPLQELISRKTIVPASSLSESEMVDLCDALLIYQSMFMKSEHITTTLFTCAYLHDLSLVEGNASIKAFVRGVLKSIDLAVKAVVNADVRDGDEEFVPFTYDIVPLSDESVQSILDELDAAIKSAPEALKTRLTLQRALIAAADGFSTIHSYQPTEQPAAMKKRNEYVESMTKKREERQQKLKEAAEKAKEAKKNNKEGAAASSSSSPAAETEEAEEEEQELPSSLMVFTKEELDNFRPKNIDVNALTKAYQAAVNAWHRSGEPTKTEKAFSKYAPLWVSGASPSKQPDLAPLASAKQFYKELASNFNALVQLKQQKVFNNWYVLLNAVKSFSASAGVVARSIAMLFIYNPAVDLILDSKSFPECILHTCDVIHGQPLYSHLYFEHHDLVTAITNSHFDKSGALPESIKKNPKMLKRATEGVKRQFIDTTREMIQDAARGCFRYIHTLLRAKGAIHRTLPVANIPNIAQTLQQAGSIEGRLFNVIPAKGTQPQAPDAKTLRHFVLSAFLNEVMCDMVEVQLNLEVQLDLISKPETIALQMYRFFNVHSRIENANNLFVDQAALPSAASGTAKNKNSLKNLIDANGAAAACRQAKPAALNVMKSFEAVKVAANVAFMVLSCLGPVKSNKLTTSGIIPGLDQGEFSLVSTETIVDRRFANLRMLLGASLFPTYKDIVRSTANLADAKTTIARGIDLLQPVIANFKKHVETKSGANQALPLTVAFDTVARQNLAVMMLAKGLIENAEDKNLDKVFAGWKFDFEYVSGYPQLLRFTLAQKA